MVRHDDFGDCYDDGCAFLMMSMELQDHDCLRCSWKEHHTRFELECKGQMKAFFLIEFS